MVRFPSLNIRGQLLLAMLVVATVVILVAVSIETRKHTATLRVWAAQEAESVAAALSHDFLKLIVLGEPDGAANLVEQFTSFALIQNVVLYDDKGKAIFQYRRDKSGAPASANDRFTVTRELNEQGTVYGKVELTVSGEKLRTGISEYYRYLAALVLALFGISVIAVFYAQRFFTGPVLALTGFMRRVTAERDFGLRIPRERTDEFGVLFGGLNALLAEMQSAQRNILQQNAELSAAVEQIRQHEKTLIAEHRAKEDALNAKLEAESANREKSAFLASMSHELRTPLNAIIGYSELLDEDATDKGDKRTSEDLRKIRAAGQHLLSLINDVLDLSKIEAGKMQLDLHDFDVGALVEDTLPMISPLLARRNNRLEKNIVVAGLAMHSDPIRIRQVLFNLLSNACKFTQDGTITISAQRGDAAHADRVLFSVRDTGAGMTPEDLKKLFQPFVQADSVGRKHEGTGLGLALSRRFCVMMGGEIHATSVQGQGSEFSFWLPLDVRAAKAGC